MVCSRCFSGKAHIFRKVVCCVALPLDGSVVVVVACCATQRHIMSLSCFHTSRCGVENDGRDVRYGRWLCEYTGDNLDVIICVYLLFTITVRKTLYSQRCSKILMAVQVSEATSVVARVLQLRVLNDEPTFSSFMIGDHLIPFDCIVNFLAILQPQYTRLRLAYSSAVETHVLPQ